MIAVVASAFLFAAAGTDPAPAADQLPVALAGRECVLSKDATAEEMIQSCRTMIPKDVESEGRIILRNRKGFVQKEFSYRLERRAGETSLSIRDTDGAEQTFDRKGPILGTDVTWSDITLEYLWWDKFAFDAEKESETVHGQTCSVIMMTRGDRTVRVWVDRKTGAMMQAEEIVAGKPVRRLWGTRIKKFGERWAPNVLEVETLGSGHRTKITVEKLK